jgi:WD40-like Beta Propeller Repeat
VKRRDALIVAAVLVIAGVAAADGLRPDAGVDEGETQTDAEAAEPEAREHAAELDLSKYRPGVLSGTLVFTEPGEAARCRVRAVALTAGEELPLPRLTGDCRLWAPPRGRNVAYGLGSRHHRVPFAVLDLDDPSRDLPELAAIVPSVSWSLDGDRAAWCDPHGRGVEYDVERNRFRRLPPRCTFAYTPEGDATVTERNRLVVDGRTLVRSSGDITYARWGQDGSVALVLDRRRLERWKERRRTHTAAIPVELAGSPPILSPDNCAGLFFSAATGSLEHIRLGCSPRGHALDSQAVPGTTAAWSPDGEWIAWTAGRGSRWIGFERVDGAESLVLGAEAVELAWLD